MVKVKKALLLQWTQYVFSSFQDFSSCFKRLHLRTNNTIMVQQIEFKLPVFKRGIHLITDKIMAQLPALPAQGLLHVFVKHTSASISINENADPSVRADMHTSIENMIPENQPHFTHLDEGPDDMPGHIKLALIGNEVTVPITNHSLNLGIWQGFYFHEFRNHPAVRSLVLTIMS